MLAARSLVLVALAGCAAKTPPPASTQPAPLYIIPAADPHAPAPVPSPPPASDAQIAAAPPAVINSVFASDLPMIPPDSELVVGVNAAKLQQSALWATLSPRFAAKIPWIPVFTKACGFDPVVGLTTATLGMKGLKNAKAEGVIVVHGVPTAKLSACIPKLQKLVVKSDTKLTVDQDTFTFVEKDGQTATFGFADPTTLVIVLGPNAAKATLDNVKAGTSPLRTSVAFMDMFAQISPTDAVVMLVNGSAVGTSQLGINTKAIFGSADLNDKLTLDFRVRMQSVDEAQQLATMAQSQTNSAQVKAMFERLDVLAEGADVRVGVTMVGQSLEMLLGMIMH
jgi:hypothetical protein